MNLKHSYDVSQMSQAISLDREEKDILGHLEVDHAVVKLQGRWLSVNVVRLSPVSTMKFEGFYIKQKPFLLVTEVDIEGASAVASMKLLLHRMLENAI